jgi:hypothetical protein
MAISPNTLDWINGKGSSEKLDEARKANAKKIGNRVMGASLSERLKEGERNGVVDGDYSQSVRTGEVPVVDEAEDAKDAEDVFATATPVEDLPEGQFGEVVKARSKVNVQDQSHEETIEVNHN